MRTAVFYGLSTLAAAVLLIILYISMMHILGEHAHDQRICTLPEQQEAHEHGGMHHGTPAEPPAHEHGGHGH